LHNYVNSLYFLFCISPSQWLVVPPVAPTSRATTATATTTEHLLPMDVAHEEKQRLHQRRRQRLQHQL
jgi:hypothetical protein